jgi:GNAT superfamily N-acetyltransferase
MRMQTFLTFRPATPQDIPLLNHLMRNGKGYWGYPEEGLDRFMKTFGIQDESYFETGFGFIAKSGDDVIGQYLFKIEEDSPMLDHFFLNTTFIGQGYGRLLWEHCISEAQKRGWDKFSFWSDPYSQGFYEHMGAIKIDARPMVTLPGHMAPIMSYALTKER